MVKRNIKKILFIYSPIWIILAIILLLSNEKSIILSLNNNPESEGYMNFIKLYTDLLYLIIGLTAVFTLLSLFVEKLEPYRRRFLITLVTYVVTFGIVSLLKIIIGRIRPYVKYPNEVNSFGETEDDFAMPSGHTAYSTVTTIPIVLDLDAKSKKTPFWTILLCGFNIFMGYTRLYLGLHWLSDVLFGSIVGVILSICIVILMDWLYDEKKLSKKAEIIIGCVCIILTILTNFV